MVVEELNYRASGTVVSAIQIPNTQRAAFIVLVDRGDGYAHRYVVSLYYNGNTEWVQGYYGDNIHEATKLLLTKTIKYIFGVDLPWVWDMVDSFTDGKEIGERVGDAIKVLGNFVGKDISNYI